MGRGLDFEGAVEAAWQDFRRALADRLADLGEDEQVLVEMEVPADGGPAPYAQFMGVGSDRVRAELVSNHFLAGARRLSVAQRRALREMGWGAPARAVDGQPPSERPNYQIIARGRDADRLAAVTVRALREVHGCVDPSFLATRGLGLAPAPVAGPALDLAGMAHPVDAEHLRTMVAATLEDFFGSPAETDADGDLPITVGESRAFVRVAEDRALVLLFAVAVVDATAPRPELIEAVTAVNDRYAEVHFRVVDSSVYATADLAAWPFVPQQLVLLVDRFCSALPEWVDELIELVGGHAFLAEAATPTPAAASEVAPTAVVSAEPTGSLDCDDYMTCLIALSEVLRVGPIDSERVSALFDHDVARLRTALVEEATTCHQAQLELSEGVVEHLRRGLRRALRRSVTLDRFDEARARARERGRRPGSPSTRSPS